MLLAVLAGAAGLCDPPSLPVPNSTAQTPAEQLEAFNNATEHVNATYNTNGVALLNIQAALQNANEGIAWLSTNTPSYLLAAQDTGLQSCLLVALRDFYNDSALAYQVLWMVSPSLSSLMPSALDPGLPPLMASYLNVTSNTPTIALATFTAIAEQALLLETFTAKFVALAPTASATSIQGAVYACLQDLTAALTAAQPALVTYATTGDFTLTLTQLYALYQTSAYHYQLVWNFTPLASQGIPDVSALLPANLDPGYPSLLATAMGVAETGDISAAFQTTLLGLFFTDKYYRYGCCPEPTDTSSSACSDATSGTNVTENGWILGNGEVIWVSLDAGDPAPSSGKFCGCTAAAAACTVSYAAVQAAVADPDEGLPKVTEAATALLDGLTAAASGDTFKFIAEVARVYAETPLLWKLLYAYTPIESQGIPAMADSVPSLNPGLPRVLAEAIGIPAQAEPIPRKCKKTADCVRKGGLRQSCFYKEYPGGDSCGCRWSTTFVYPFCEAHTSKTQHAKGIYIYAHTMFAITTVIILALIFKRIFILVKKHECNRKSLLNSYSTTLIFNMLANLGIFALYGLSLDEINNPVDYQKAYNLYRDEGVLQVVAAMFFPLAAMNVSMMWIEFAMASKRMASMSNNLKFTKNLIIGYMVFFVTLASIFLYITVGPPADPPEPIDVNFEDATLSLFALNGFVTGATFVIGGKKMYFMMIRHSKAERSTMTGTMKTATTTTQSSRTSHESDEEEEDGPGASNSQEDDAQFKASQAKVKSLEAKARMVGSTSILLSISSISLGFILILFIVLPRVDAWGVYWANRVFFIFFLNLNTVACARYLNHMMGPMPPVFKSRKVKPDTKYVEENEPEPEQPEQAVDAGSKADSVEAIRPEEPLTAAPA